MAWSDKHPAYSSVSGPGSNILDDFYAPEINSNVVALPGVSTPAGASCATVRDPGSDLTAWTNSFENIQCYDTLKVNAISIRSPARPTTAKLPSAHASSA